MTTHATPPSTKAPSPLPAPSDLRTLGPWYAIECLNSYAATLATAGCYDYANSVLRVSPSTSLWLTAFWGFSYIFICLNAGRLSERLGPRRVVGISVLGAVLASLTGLASIAIPNVFMLLAVMLPFNISSSAIWPAIESAITRTRANSPLTTRTALYNLSWGSSGFVAFFTCGALERWWWGNIFLFPALCSALSLLIFYLWAAPENMIGKDHVPEEPPGTREIQTPALLARAKRLLLMAWIGNALAYVAINVLIAIKVPLAAAAGITSLTTIGIITSVWGFMRFAGFFLTWKWAGWHYKVGWLLGSQIALTMSFALMLLCHDSITLIVTEIFFGLAAALIYASSLYYAMHVSDGHGGHAGIHEALIGLGIALGPAIGALAGAGKIGPTALTRVAIAVTILLLLGIAAMSILAPGKDKLATDAHG